MGKFFKRGPEKCSICGETKEVRKKMRSGLITLIYCRECYDDYYKRVEGEVKRQVEEAVKSGQKIGRGDALALTKKITSEIEAEAVKNMESPKGD